MRFYWQNLTGTWDKFIEDVKSIPNGRLWRHNQAGDLPHDNGVIDRAALDHLVAANRGKRGFTFTHHDMSIPENREAVKEANAKGFTINLSANGIGEIDSLVALGIGPIATVLPMDAPEAGNGSRERCHHLPRCHGQGLRVFGMRYLRQAEAQGGHWFPSPWLAEEKSPCLGQ